MASYTGIREFSIAVSDEQLHELRAKLNLTCLPDELDLPAGQEWDWGIPLAVVKPILEYWRTQYDWRVVEKHINQTLPQFTTCIDSLDHGTLEVHFVHRRSNNPNATPLIFVSKIIDELTNPKDPMQPAFHVVAPSLPGYVFSQRASAPGMSSKASAYIFDKLMAKLGYSHYMAQGGDWGYFVCRAFAVYHQDTCLATHTNIDASSPTFFRNPLMVIKTMFGFVGLPGGYSKADVESLKATQEFWDEGSGYGRIQSTRPQTLAFALTDSPVGLLAGIGEKLYAWTDKYPWTADETITWAMLYWIKGPAGGLRYYKDNSLFNPPREPNLLKDHLALHSQWSPTLHGYSSFPKEISRTPLEWGGINHNLIYTNKHNKGGHFAAWEVVKISPELLVADIQNFARVALEKEPRLAGVA